jgi:hypothetical protein
MALAGATLSGCGPAAPAATVDGTLRANGTPLDNCLVTFVPESSGEEAGRHSTGLTDAQGAFRLRFDNQQEGAAIGRHLVIIQDLSVSTGVHRRDNGTVDADLAETTAPPPVARRSRIPVNYTLLAKTPLHKEVKLGHQTIDLEIK